MHEADLDWLDHESHDVWVAFELAFKRRKVIVRDKLKARHVRTKPTIALRICNDQLMRCAEIYKQLCIHFCQ